MSKPLEPGTWGVITTKELPSGSVQARGLFRDWTGAAKMLKASADTAERAEAKLLANAGSAARASAPIGPRSTIAELAAWWLDMRRSENSIKARTLSNYRNDSKLVVTLFGELRISELTPAIVKTNLMGLAKNHAHAATRCRSVLRQMMDEAVVMDVGVRHNPVLSVKRPVIKRAKPISLNDEQVQAVRECYRTWLRLRNKPGPSPDPRIIDLIDVMLGTGLRIGEVLALRTCDVNLAESPPTMHVGATIVRSEEHGRPEWQDHTKHENQRRDIRLPKIAVTALRPYLNPADPKAPLFPNRKGEWLATNHVHRNMRRFRDEFGAMLELEEIKLTTLTPHIFRRTVATMIAFAHGVDKAKEQLGHASIQTTERHYLTPSRKVDSGLADILDERFG